ncbi:competence/damage-inducible protein A [Modestobacter sp. NPDC049651]|uniref:competence/damage-inducible protein A n=1 Tax=unclassified Modestobacter TaxID=2643866 RepID=UPI0033C41197
MAVRAGIVVTGTEVLTGRVADRNGPWLAEQLRQLGVDVGSVVVVGDRAADLYAALGFLAAGNDLVITTGGLGPTADDLTAQVVADHQGRPVHLDPALEQRIAGIVARLTAARGWATEPESTAAATAKQAQVPDGATVLEPVGTAPGLVVPPAAGRTGPPVVVLPGPPPELQGMWPAVLAAEPVRRVLAGAGELRQETLRLWRTPESELAETLRRVDDQLTGLEVTTCLRDGELEIVTRFAPDAAPAYDRLVAAVRTDFGATLFSEGPDVDALVAGALADRGLTLAVAEADTGGALSARLSARAGASRWFLGGVAAYADAAKRELLGVPAGTLDTHGAVSPEVAAALADGARARFGADVGIGVTGIAGPGGGTPGKPVGTVHLVAVGPDGSASRSLVVGGGREAFRQRTTTVSLQLVRSLLLGGPTA